MSVGIAYDWVLEKVPSPKSVANFWLAQVGLFIAVAMFGIGVHYYKKSKSRRQPKCVPKPPPMDRLKKLFKAPLPQQSIPQFKGRRIPSTFLEAQREPESSIPSELRRAMVASRFFGCFDHPTLLDIYQQVETIHLKVGDIVFKGGDSDNSIFLVHKGLINLYYKDGTNLPGSGNSPVHGTFLSEVHGGKSISSLLSVLENAIGREVMFHNLTAVCMTEAVILRMPMEALQHSLNKRPETMIKVLEMILKKLHRVTFLTLNTYLGITGELVREDVCPQHPPVLASSSPSLDELEDAGLASLGKTLDLTDDDVRGLKGKLRVVELAAGIELYHPGSTSGELIFVVDGAIEITAVSPENQTIPMYTVRPGDFAGVLSFLTSEATITLASTVAGSCTYAFCITREEFFSKIVSVQPRALLTVAVTLLDRLSPFVRLMDFALDWAEVPAGQSVFDEGSPPNEMYIVIHGRVRTAVVRPDGSKEFVDELGRGETLGELEMLVGIERVTSCLAIRDSELVVIPKGALEYMKRRVPTVMSRFTQIFGRRLLDVHKPQAAQGETKNIATVAVVPLSPDVPMDLVTRNITCTMSNIGPTFVATADVIDEHGCNSIDLLAFFHQVEEKHRIVLYQADYELTEWTQKCLRQSDLVLLVGMGHNSPELSPIEQRMTEMGAWRTKLELVLLHDESVPPSGTVDWLNCRTSINIHHHVRCTPAQLRGFDDEARLSQFVDPGCVRSDWARLGRWLTGNTFGVVLGGGGARGLSHIGVLRAIEEAGLPIDMIGGTSIGSLVGAMYAGTTNSVAVHSNIKGFCKDMKSLWLNVTDLTYPRVSMFTGANFNAAIRDVFGDGQIEDMWIPYFCTSTDITDCKLRIHKHGTLWRYVRASMSLSGYFPPICDPMDGHYLLDGGYINNLPADVIRSSGANTILAVDVGARDNNDLFNYGDDLSGWWLLFKRWSPWTTAVNVPDAYEIQNRLAYVASTAQLSAVQGTDWCEYVRPPIDAFGLLQFDSLDEIEDVGYAYGRGAVQTWAEKHHLSEVYFEREGLSATMDAVIPKHRRRGSLSLDVKAKKAVSDLTIEEKKKLLRSI